MFRRLRMATRAGRLDAELAAGASPALHPDLTLRAAQLGRERLDYAHSLRRVAEGRNRSVPINRAATQELRPALLLLADTLEGFVDPAPRGLALTARLLIDVASPLYRQGGEDELLAAVEAARRAL